MYTARVLAGAKDNRLSSMSYVLEDGTALSPRRQGEKIPANRQCILPSCQFKFEQNRFERRSEQYNAQDGHDGPQEALGNDLERLPGQKSQ